MPIIQSLAQLEKNYGSEGAEIIIDNCQDTIFGGFAPNSQTADTLSEALGNRTVLSGTVNRGKDNSSQNLQMMQRRLMTPDELKSIPKGHFVVMKTGTHPMKTRLRLFLDWGISFESPYLQHVLVQLPYLGKTHSHEELESLMPWAPYIQQKFRMKNSDAYLNTYID